MTHDEMKQLTAGTDVKAEKIRILFDAGATRAEIRDFLGITYQHVQNVLRRSKRIGTPNETPETMELGNRVYPVTLAKNGTISLPEDLLVEQGMYPGDRLVCSGADGRLTLMSEAAAIEALRRRMPTEAALLEALLGDRVKST